MRRSGRPRRSSSVRQPSTSAETTSRFHIVDKITTGLVNPDRFSFSIDLRPCDNESPQGKTSATVVGEGSAMGAGKEGRVRGGN